MKLGSACLLGIRCRYDGKSTFSRKVIALLKTGILISVCPKQLWGLPTPREPAEIKDNRVITKSGKHVTENFKLGAMKL